MVTCELEISSLVSCFLQLQEMQTYLFPYGKYGLKVFGFFNVFLDINNVRESQSSAV